ncbi:MAG: MATE family efflux transporter [Lachnospiraceae bacterium]|nr:MATE family efflux transporter [Lachnospiraceae bacterium]
MSNLRQKYIGDRNFYKHVLYMVIPMIMQNLITNFVSMIDNIMVGQLGTAPMSGVSIVNQFVFVANITVFGAVSGASIYGTQYFGKGDHEGQKFTFRFRLIAVLIIIGIFAVVFVELQEPLIRLFLSKDDSREMIETTLTYGREYMGIIVLSLFPFGIGQAYASTIRESGETNIPMAAAFSAVGVNLLLDYGLIFGKLGMPEMGVQGAAIATVIAKTIEAAVMIIWTHTHLKRMPSAVGLYRGFHIPQDVIVNIIKTGTPLLLNEFLWSLGMAVVAQCYSARGIDMVAARNIANTLTNLFNVIFIQMGACIGIMVGMELGSGDLKRAKDVDNKMIVFSFVITVFFAIAMVPVGYAFPMMYKTEPVVRSLATYYILISAMAMPMWSFTNAVYFTLRSGGKTLLTFIFDMGLTWSVMIPVAWFLCYKTDMDIHWVIVLVMFTEIIKVIIGFFMVRSNLWLNDLVGEER